jgi:hypothetical protein
MATTVRVMLLMAKTELLKNLISTGLASRASSLRLHRSYRLCIKSKSNFELIYDIKCKSLKFIFFIK